MQIFLARNNVQAGPYTLDQLNIMLTSGEVVLDDLVWHEGLDQWQRLGDVTGNQFTYRPTVATPNDSIINNVTVFPEDSNKSASAGDKKVSIDRLYGKPERPKADAKNAKANMTTNRHHTPHNNVSLNKPSTSKLASSTDKVIGNVVLPLLCREY